MELTDVLARRRSTRRFTDEPLTDGELSQILMAGQTAPLAAGDDKTTHMTLVKDPALLDEIREVCAMRRKTGERVDALYNARAVVLVSATDVSEDHIEYCNAGCVIENMHLRATDLGLGSVYIWGCLRKLRADEALVAKLGLPEGYEILSALALGHAEAPLEPREYKDKISVNII